MEKGILNDNYQKSEIEYKEKKYHFNDLEKLFEIEYKK